MIAFRERPSAAPRSEPGAQATGPTPLSPPLANGGGWARTGTWVRSPRGPVGELRPARRAALFDAVAWGGRNPNRASAKAVKLERDTFGRSMLNNRQTSDDTLKLHVRYATGRSVRTHSTLCSNSFRPAIIYQHHLGHATTKEEMMERLVLLARLRSRGRSTAATLPSVRDYVR